MLVPQTPFLRKYGILLPVFSLPNQTGIGTFGQSAYRFIDFLSAAGAAYWQMLPLGPTGYGNSPYQSSSAFAGNPYFIDPEILYSQGKLTKNEYKNFLTDFSEIDYGYLYQTRLKNYYPAFLKCTEKQNDLFLEYVSKNGYWLYDYAAFSVLKQINGGCSRHNFKTGNIKTEEIVNFVKENHRELFDFYCYLQFEFDGQLYELKQYANKNKVCLIGDLPLYVADDSADIWAAPDLFETDDFGKMKRQAGVPPDIFSATGQLWGNPLYNYNTHRRQNFEWWTLRVKRQFKHFDILRLDHFIGYSKYYAVNADSQNAANGTWAFGPAADLFETLQKNIPYGKYIAEDLGLKGAETIELLKQTGFPEMRLLQCAFNQDPHNYNLPQYHKANTVLYTGTHDNHTLIGAINQFSKSEKQFAENYLAASDRPLNRAIIREGFKSVANTFIAPLQDFLELDDTARINTPATAEQNWTFRLKELPNGQLSKQLNFLANLYERSN